MKPVQIVLFAPGNKERLMAKALESGADAVLLDLEDSVPIAVKAEARSMVAKVIDGVAAPGSTRAGPAVFVRVNAGATGLLEDDLAEIVVMIERALGVYRCFDFIHASPRVAGACIGVARDGDIKDSKLSARLGYVGRTVIHPEQIAPVRRAYAVPEADVACYH